MRQCDRCSGDKEGSLAPWSLIEHIAGDLMGVSSGKVKCNRCRGKGKVDGEECRTCWGDGKVECPKCHGTGRY
jgi:RecJ-like exonuclease